jgi:AcrR family transcriptional regulator
MIASAARYGLGGASVARVVREAGVSRATFYEHFDDRDDCFLAAHQQVAAEVEETFARSAEGPPAVLLGELLRGAERDPAAARVGLIEGLAGDPAVRGQHEALLSSLEERVENYLRESPSPVGIPARAVLGGVIGVIAIRVFRGEAGQMEELRDDLLTWIGSYALEPGEQRLTEAGWRELGGGLEGSAEESLGPDVLSRSLPRGRGALSPSRVASEQRQRILAAVAELARQKGYGLTTVADLIATAGVTREAFYEQFRSKEDAFLATQAFGLETSVAFTAGRFFGQAAWRDRVWDGLQATLSYVASQRGLMYVDLVESYAAGTVAIRRSFDNRMAYTLFLEEGYRERPEAGQLPRLVSEGISGAIQELFRRQVMIGRGGQMLELLPLAAYLTLAPFIGSTSALELVKEKLRAPRQDPRGPRARA